MSDDAIIKVENLGKRYRLGAGRSNERYTALRDVISENVRGVFKKLKSEKLGKSGKWVRAGRSQRSQHF